MSEALQRTELYQWHVEHGGRMVPFAGWEMPVQYPLGPIEEHHATRRSAGLFDIDHMGQFEISGPQATAYLNHLVTSNISLMSDYQAKYGLLCYENGGIIDDLFIYKLPERWFVVVNAANLATDLAWMTKHQTDYEVTVRDVSAETYMLALQGPQAIPLLQHLAPADLQLHKMPRFSAVEEPLHNIPTLIGRTGYTGEDGVELYFPPEQAVPLWTAILEAGEEHGIEVQPIGLAARDSLRFEPSFPLYGHELSAEVTPLEAGLQWACDFDTPFIGHEALIKQQKVGLNKKIITFALTEKGMPREGYDVTSAEGEPLGEVVTGLYAPTVEQYCGNAFVPPPYAAVGTPLNIVIRNKPKAAQVVKRPLYLPSYRK